MSAREDSRNPDRRRFLITTLAAGIGASLPATVFARARRPTAKPRVKPTPTPPAAPGATPPSDDAKALAAILKRRYPHLDEPKLTGITRDLDQRLEGARRLRAVKLANAAEPDTTFRA